jgi:hypothetical protein
MHWGGGTRKTGAGVDDYIFAKFMCSRRGVLDFRMNATFVRTAGMWPAVRDLRKVARIEKGVRSYDASQLEGRSRSALKRHFTVLSGGSYIRDDNR